jgi:ribosome maturation factor RimP
MLIGVVLDYIPLETLPYYKDCAPLVEGLGYKLVELHVVPQKTVKITAVIASIDSTKDIGVNDCAKVHHALLPRLEAILGTEDTYMELTSPGMERNIKNAAEFEIFKGREVRVWDKTVTDWVSGVIVSSDDKSVTMEKDGETRVFSYENIAKAKFIHL